MITSALFAVLLKSNSSQDLGTVVDMSSLLSMNLYAANGALQVKNLYIAFPNPEAKYRLVVAGGGSEIYTCDMYFSELAATPAFGLLQPVAPANGTCILAKDGNYTVSLQNGSEILSKLDFTVSSFKIGDEFTGRTVQPLDGPWRKYAAFVLSPGGVNDMVFRVWSSLTETKSPVTQKLTGKITKGAQVVASSATQIVSKYEFVAFDLNFVQPDGRTTFSANSLSKLSGSYEMRIFLDGKEMRVFPFTVANGKVDNMPESALNFPRRHEHWVPRTVVGASNNYNQRLYEAYWLKVKAQ